MKIYIKNGVIFEITQENIVGTIKADMIANKNGLVYAEHFVNKYNGQILKLNKKLKIKEVL